jgi:uncharacterized protein YegL
MLQSLNKAVCQISGGKTMSELQQPVFGNMNYISGVNMPSSNEPRLACVLLVDTSYSMSGEAINSLNRAINDFRQRTMMDEKAAKRVEVAIIEFNSRVNLVRDFVPVSAMEPVTLMANGTTAMGKGICFAIDKAKERTYYYNAMKIPYFNPWIFMITDGEPDEEEDMYSAMLKINDEEEMGRLKFFALGVKNYNKDILFSLTRRVIELQNVDFSSIFDWLREKVVTMSNGLVDGVTSQVVMTQDEYDW